MDNKAKAREIADSLEFTMGDAYMFTAAGARKAAEQAALAALEYKEGSCLTSCVNYEGCRIDLDHFENKCKQLQSDNECLQRELNALRPNPDHDAAIAAGDGTLHGAIDYWQGESDRLQKRVSELEGLLDTANGFLVCHPDFKAKVEQALGESNE